MPIIAIVSDKLVGTMVNVDNSREKIFLSYNFVAFAFLLSKISCSKTGDLAATNFYFLDYYVCNKFIVVA